MFVTRNVSFRLFYGMDVCRRLARIRDKFLIYINMCRWRVFLD